jgi:uncharacterized protein
MAAMRIVATGGTGFLGRRIVERLAADGHDLHLLGRAPRKGLPAASEFSLWDPVQGEPPRLALEGADAVLHLAGEPIAQRWTREAKRRIRASRVDGTGHLVSSLATLQNRPAVLVCASAVGYYGDRGDERLTESATAGAGFLADVCVGWEQAALRAKELGMRVVLLRTGVVFGRGGALDRMLPPFRWGLGGKFGAGDQWMTWIHVEDVVQIVQMALEDASLQGPVNVAAPNPATNAEFTAALGRALRRPALLTVPAAAVRLLFGEMAEVVLASQRAVPAALEAAGYPFRFPEVQTALQDVLSE